MVTITICNHKGGTGKTTSAIHLAAAMGLSGKRVLVIDLDPQGFLTRMLGIEEPQEAASSLALFNPQARLSELAFEEIKGFDLLPASSLLTNRLRRLNKPTDVLWVKEALEEDLDYDIVLIDTAAAITVYSLNALVASQFVVIPVTPEYQPVLGGEQTFQTSLMVRSKLNPTLAEPYFLLTQVDGRKRSHHMYRRYLRSQYKDRVLSGIIRTSTALSVSHADRSTVYDSDPYSRGAHDYANSADEILGIVYARQEAEAAEALSEPKAEPTPEASNV